MNTSLADSVLDTIVTDVGIDADHATINTLYTDLDLDSLVLVELALQLSKRYNVEVTEEDLRTAGSAAGTATLLSGKGVGV